MMQPLLAPACQLKRLAVCLSSCPSTAPHCAAVGAALLRRHPACTAHWLRPSAPLPTLQLSVLRLFEAILSDVSIKRAPDFQVRAVPPFHCCQEGLPAARRPARASVCRWPAGGSAVLAAVVPRLNASARCPCRTCRPSAVQMMCASLPHRFPASLLWPCRTCCRFASRRSATCLHGEEQRCSDMTGCSLEPLHGCMCWRARQRRGLGTVLLSAPRLAWK